MHPVPRKIAKVLLYPWYKLESRVRPPSRWTSITCRALGVGDSQHDPRISLLVESLRQTADVPGEVAECGVFQGISCIRLALAIKEQGLAKTLYALDSFSGFDESADQEAAHLKDGVDNPVLLKGGFSETSVALLNRKIREVRVESIVKLVPGYFCDSLPTLPERRYSFVHLDCDLAKSYRECLEYFYPRLNQGGIIHLDEYDHAEWPLTKKVIDDFFGARDEELVPVSRTLRGKRADRWYIRKAH